MSTGFSNTNTGSKPADPYKEANADNNASIQERVDDMIKFIEQRKFCMLTTRKSDNGYLVSRCMALAGREDAVDLLFHTNNESGKTDELVGDNHVNVAFLNSTNGDWASISGTAQVITDREYVKKHYSPDLKAWLGDLGDGVHDGSYNDPRVGVIKVHIRTATYALQKGTAIGRMVEVAKGAVTGQTASVNKLRELSESDLDTYRTSQRMVQ